MVRTRVLTALGIGLSLTLGTTLPAAAAPQDKVEPQLELPPLNEVICTELNDSGDSLDTEALVMTPVTPRDSTSLESETATLQCHETGISTTPVELTLKAADETDNTTRSSAAPQNIVARKVVGPDGNVTFGDLSGYLGAPAVVAAPIWGGG